MSPAFDCFLLFALLNGMILGHDADRRHPCPDDHAALAGVVSRLRAHPPARLRKPGHLLAAAAELAARRLHQLLLDRDRNRQLDRWPALPPRRPSGAGRTMSSRAVREAVTSA